MCWTPDLQLNAGKSAVILLGTAVQLRSEADITTIDIAGSPLPVALKLKSLGVIIESSTFWCPCQRGRQGMQSPHSRSTSCAPCAVGRNSADYCMQHSDFQTGLLQRHPIWCSAVITRQTTASAEQSGKGRVSAKPDYWRQTVVAVSSLAAYQGAHPVQDGTLDIQDTALVSYKVSLYITGLLVSGWPNTAVIISYDRLFMQTCECSNKTIDTYITVANNTATVLLATRMWL